MDTVPLKPCPFCGSPAEYQEDSGSWGYTPPSVRVQCTTCWVKTPSEDTSAWKQGLGHYTVRHEARVMVAEIWNKRAEPS